MAKRDSQKADETVGVCETLAREALDDVRLSVRTLQTENDPSLIESLKQLTEDFAKMQESQQNLRSAVILQSSRCLSIRP